MERDWKNQRSERMWGHGGDEWELTRRLATTLRELLESAPTFDEMRAKGQLLMTWESAGYKAAKRRGWDLLEEAERRVVVEG